MSEMKRLPQSIYDDHMYHPDKIVIEQIICGKKYRFVLPQDNQDQRQWLEINRESHA